MGISLNIKPKDEEALREAWGAELDRAAFESLVAESYRCDRISMRQVAELLGFEIRHEAQEWLAKRGVPLNYNLEDLEQDRRTLAKLFPDFKP